MKTTSESNGKAKWLVVRNYEIDGEFDSYASAKFYAQCTHCTDASPMRDFPGSYTLKRSRIVRKGIYEYELRKNSL